MSRLCRLSGFAYMDGVEQIQLGFDADDLKQLAAELKLYREFVGAMGTVGFAECYGRYEDGAFWLFDDNGEGIATGTDPFDAFCNMRNIELSEVESDDA